MRDEKFSVISQLSKAVDTVKPKQLCQIEHLIVERLDISLGKI